MAELIDRDKCQERIFRFAKRLEDWGMPDRAKAVRAVAKGIKLEKTVDAVEVVRCKDCTKWKEPWLTDQNCGKCTIGKTAITGPTHFCSYGERRTDG